MGVWDRLQATERQAESREPMGERSLTMSESSTLAVCDPPVIVRLKGVVAALNTIIQRAGPAKGDGIGRFSFVMTTVLEEIMDELAETRSPGDIEVYLAQIGKIIEWVGHGNNEALPEQLRPFAEMIMPTAPIDKSQSVTPALTDGNEEKAS